MNSAPGHRLERSARQRVRPVAQALLAAVLVLAVGAGIWQAHVDADRSLPAKVQAVTSGLRCPTCSGQSVADSESDLAQQMRAVTAQQLAAGRTPEQVRAYFVARYGNQVLLDPPLSGLGLATRLAPFALLIIGGLILSRRLGGRRGIAFGAAFTIGLSGVLVAAGALDPVIGATSSNAEPATVQTPTAVRSPTPTPTPTPAPTSTSTTGVHAALVALRAGDDATAEREARTALSRARKGSRAWQDALLVLGLAEHDHGDSQASATLRRFLHEAPHHPAAPMVRKLLAKS